MAAKHPKLRSLADAEPCGAERPTGAADGGGSGVSAETEAAQQAKEGGTGKPPAAADGVRKTRKRENYLVWDDYFMSVAFLSAMRSKDPSTQVGAW